MAEPVSPADAVSLGGSLRNLRRRAGLTQREAADLAGVSVAGLRDLEQGRVRAPRADTLRRLSAALGLSSVEAGALARLGQAGHGGPDHPHRIWIGVLGPLLVRVNGEAVDLGSESQRVLLGLLALSPNTPVGRELLIESVWGSQAPTMDVLQSRISRLRRRLQSGQAEPGTPLLATTGGGYQLTAGEEQLDLLAFRGLVRRARRLRLDGELPQACGLFADAIARWRGEPLAGLSALTDHPAVVSAVREWRSAVVDYAAVAIDLARYEEVVPLLRRLVETHPLHEVAHARLMLALAGGGRPAAALTIFDRIRRRLADELGSDPGPELAGAHVRVLRQQVGRPEVSPVRAHRQLPADIADFSGRDAELRTLGDLAPAGPGAAVVAAIVGMGGAGKTRLAVHLAHQLVAAGRYAEQQLYVDLHGHADQPAADPAAVLAGFLELLDVPSDRLPVDLAGRSALYRELLDHKHALVLLDNAASEEQLASLLPASPTNLVLVTSRRTLALPGAHCLPLGGFTEPEATGFLAGVLGADRVGTDPAATRRVIDECGGLPLAVALVARRLQARPAWTMADLAARLDLGQSRLDELAAGTGRLRATFALSYRALPPTARQLFRQLGHHPGDDVTAESAAALAGTTPAAARRTLDQLAAEHLVLAAPGDRFRLHRLLREYARELARQDGAGA